MPTILIRLEPARLANPDADLRYVLPDRLVEASRGRLRDDGFDYEDGTDAMLVFLAADDLAAVLPDVIDLLENHDVLGNRLADAAIVGTSAEDACERLADCIVAYPRIT